MKRYERYRDSGIKWLGEIPEHWDVKRAKTMFVKENRPVKENDDIVTCFRDGIVTLRKNRRTTGFTEAIKESGYQGIKKGDLVIHGMDAFAGSVGVSDSDGKGTPVYSVCSPIGAHNNHYYAHIIRQMAYSGYILSLSRGIRERSSDFRFDVFGNQYLPIPPQSEQEQIVRFLDGRLALIDKYVKEKEREVELLKELKNAEINRAVTKGLNLKAEMKDSGIEWVGEIPKHWTSLNLRSLLREKSIKGYPNEMLLSVVREQGVVPRSYDKEENHNVIPTDLSNYKLTEKGDFVINKMKAWQGSCGVSNYKGIVSPAYYVYRITYPLDKTFFNLLLRSKLYVNFFARCSDGIRVGQWDLSAMKLKSIPIWLPSLSEQNAIVAYIQQMEERINKAIVGIEREIELVKEYKTRLVSDVVTGKVDVRDINVPKE